MDLYLVNKVIPVTGGAVAKGIGEGIANMTAVLLSNRSSHTIGQLIYVDEGYVHLDRTLVNAG